MKTSLIIFSILLLTCFNTFGQVTIRGRVVDNQNKKLLAEIYHYGANISGSFIGDFEFTIDSLNQKVYCHSLGYIDKEILIKDTNFLIVEMKERKNEGRKILRDMKRQEKYKKKLIRQMRNGKVPIHGGCCFVAGSKVIMSDKSQKNIEELKIGDSVLSYNFQFEKIMKSSILNIERITHDNIIEITLEKGVKIKNTADHPYYVIGKGICSFDPESTQKNYGIETGLLEISDNCYLYNSGKLEPIKVLEIKSILGHYVTYNISDLKNNNYFVNGVLVNNESQIITP